MSFFLKFEKEMLSVPHVNMQNLTVRFFTEKFEKEILSEHLLKHLKISVRTVSGRSRLSANVTSTVKVPCTFSCQDTSVPKALANKKTRGRTRSLVPVVCSKLISSSPDRHHTSF